MLYPQPHLHTDEERRGRRAIHRFLGTLAALCFVAGLLHAVLPLPLPALRRDLLVAGFLAAGIGAGAMAHFLQAASAKHVTLLVGGAALAMACFVSIATGIGVRSPILAVFQIVICVASLTAGLRIGMRMATFCSFAVLGIASAQLAGWVGDGTPLSDGQILLGAVMQLLLVAGASAGGALTARMGRHFLQQAAAREQRLRRVLTLAAEWYWEMDDQLRYTHVTEATPQGSGVAARACIGRTPWEIEGYGLDAEAMDEHRADLESRRPFSSLLVHQTDHLGRARHARVSGEPRFDGRGVFVGYCGVGRDVTDEVIAQRNATAIESRYRELFNRTPAPLLLHRWGQVLDANPAALELLGYPTLASLIGHDLVAHYVEPTSIERVQARIAELEAAPVGTCNSSAEFDLATLDGRRRKVLVSSVRVGAPDGPATLSIYSDETERLLADAALRRSEALLSHVVATSPDAISLVNTQTGRLAMVNPSFVRLSGHAAQEAVGRTATELGLWLKSSDRDRLLEMVRSGQRAEALPISFVDKRGNLLQTLLSIARFDLDGRAYAVATARDVTQTERRRREYEAMLTYAAIGIAFTRDRIFIQANRRWEQMFGWASGALVGQAGACVWPDAAAYAEISRHAGPLLSRGMPFETEAPMRRRDGSSFLCHIRAQVIDPNDPSQGGTIWIAEDVTERRRVEQALASARDAAEAANRAKSAFLANTSHEIRTPLNGLLGLARLALHPKVSDQRRQQYLQQILDSAGNLSGILSDILDLSKIEAGKLSLESVPFDLRALLEAMQRAYEELAQAHRLSLAMHVADEVPHTVHGDPLRVRQILSNYLANALKFTERGEIRIDVRRSPDGRVRFTVSDTGVGIAPATIERLFKPFTQADESTTRRFGGTGLGLSICRELATLMGGEVGVVSQPGQGSSFWAELPLAALPPARTTRSGQLEGDDLAGAQVLLVEDNPVNMLIAASMLEQWGVQVTQAGDGRCAVDEVARADAEQRRFDAVLMDVQMPVMGGYEAARLLRRTHDPRSLPIIALTAAALLSEREEALASGMDHFLTKPIDPDKLRQTLRRALTCAG